MTRFVMTASAVLDASGNSPLNGSVSAVAFQATTAPMVVDRITVSATSRAKEALCRIYLRYIGDYNEVGRTYSGSSGDTNPDPVTVNPGEFLHIVWYGGDPGARVTATIQGDTDTVERGFRAVS